MIQRVCGGGVKVGFRVEGSGFRAQGLSVYGLGLKEVPRRMPGFGRRTPPDLSAALTALFCFQVFQ